MFTLSEKMVTSEKHLCNFLKYYTPVAKFFLSYFQSQSECKHLITDNH